MTPDLIVTPVHRGLRRATWGVLSVATAGVIGLGAYSVWRAPKPARLPKLFESPAFSLAERSGRMMSNADLRGQVWVADFIFTSCAGPCPKMTQSMADLAHRFEAKDPLRFVSITVDPARDTPAVLAEYARSFGADPVRWYFLTGEETPLRALIVNGFHVSAIPNASAGGSPAIDPHQILHSNYFLLIDADGVVRGTYDGLDPERMQHLTQDIRELLAAGGR